MTFGKLVFGCGKVDDKFYSATKGEISEEEYLDWEWAIAIIRYTMRFLRAEQSPVLSLAELREFREAKRIEKEHILVEGEHDTSRTND